MMNIFFNELSREYPQREIIIAMDQAGWHKAKDLKYPDTITLTYLPSCSPELNPVEKHWQWLRKEVTQNAIFHKLEDMVDALEHERSGGLHQTGWCSSVTARIYDITRRK